MTTQKKSAKKSLSIRNNEAFIALVKEYLEPYLIDQEHDGRRWGAVVRTMCGEANISCYLTDEKNDDMYTVFVRFIGPHLSRHLPDINKHSGKYNFHLTGMNQEGTVGGAFDQFVNHFHRCCPYQLIEGDRALNQLEGLINRKIPDLGRVIRLLISEKWIRPDVLYHIENILPE